MPEIYDEDNLLKVEGLGKTSEDIYLSYLGLIQDGFKVSVEAVAEYLRCSYQYVTENLTSKILHIRINETARSILFKHLKDNEQDQEYYFFFTKRILFDNESFRNFITGNLHYVRSYQRIYLSDFNQEGIKLIKEKLEQYNKKNKKNISLAKHMQRVLDSYVPKHFVNKPIIEQIKEFPDRLLSQKDIMGYFEIKYNVEFYRKMKREGLNKLILGNLVRYLESEVYEEYFAWTYISLYKNLKAKYGDELYLEFQKKALELL